MNTTYQFYTAKELKPSGWLRKQLELQLTGLSGNLDKVWPDIRDSAWIGGNREDWERVPYWLDGAIPLAYLLENEDLIQRIKKYVSAILSRQESDGWICPCKPENRSSYDLWALLLISKTLVVYYDCSGDEIVLSAVSLAMKNLYEGMKEGRLKLSGWGKYRWFEGFLALNLLYERNPEPWIPALAKLLKEQGADYREFTKEWLRPMNKWEFYTHIVNLTMMLKYEAVSCDLLGETYQNEVDELHQILEQNHGTAVGLFTGDECLSGLSPIQGTELCSVVEQMYSYEWLYACTGEKIWAERLEKLAFNALPATLSDDMWTHQYVQMSNQINCIRFPGRSLFRTNSSEAHLFGLEPNFGCCTANFSQGWPKFALSSWMHGNGEIVNVLPVPSVLSSEQNGIPFEIRLDTEYPFRNEFAYTICVEKELPMKLKLRIPSFAKNLTVDGAHPDSTGDLILDRVWNGKTTLHICFEANPRLRSRPNDLCCVECGSLIFSVPVEAEWIPREYEKDGVTRHYPYCDYELKGLTDWNYAFSGNSFEPMQKTGDEIPFSSRNPRLVLKAQLIPIDWSFEDGFNTVCSKIPSHRDPLGAPETKLLYPYGCAKLRMTELPLYSLYNGIMG